MHSISTSACILFLPLSPGSEEFTEEALDEEEEEDKEEAGLSPASSLGPIFVSTLFLMFQFNFLKSQIP